MCNVFWKNMYSHKKIWRCFFTSRLFIKWCFASNFNVLIVSTQKKQTDIESLQMLCSSHPQPCSRFPSPDPSFQTRSKLPLDRKLPAPLHSPTPQLLPLPPAGIGVGGNPTRTKVKMYLGSEYIVTDVRTIRVKWHCLSDDPRRKTYPQIPLRPPLISLRESH
jgi:hypothetical protein